MCIRRNDNSYIYASWLIPVPFLHGFQRSSAAALVDITTEILRTINATEKAVADLTPTEPKDKPQIEGSDVRQADEAFRQLEENVRFWYQTMISPHHSTVIAH